MTDEEFPTLVLWSAFVAKSADGAVAFELQGHSEYLIELVEVLRPTIERWGLQLVDVPARLPPQEVVVKFAGQLVSDLRELPIVFQPNETAEQTADRVKKQLIDWLDANIPRP